MKKLFSFSLVASILFAVSALVPNEAKSQVTTPRVGFSATSNNTGSAVTYSYRAITDAAGADSATLSPATSVHMVKIALTDSFYLKSPVVKRSYYGDVITIVASGSSGNKLKFAGTNFVTAGTATLSSSGRAVIQLVFDGAKYVEASRVVQ